jgi:recombinational DNA repair ATPase RecF
MGNPHGIIQLKVENFMRVAALTVDADGRSVTLSGKNTAGKSSVLDAIWAALGGKKGCPDDPIHHGAKKAKITLTTAELVVTRTFTKKGTSLKVTGADGAVFTKPQEMLAKLVGPISYDPMAWTRKPEKEQAEQVKELAGLDTSEVDGKKKAAYDERTVVNREKKRLAAQLEGLVFDADAPAEEVTAAGVAEDLRAAQETNSANDKRRLALAEMRDRAKAIIDEIEKLEAELVEVREQGKAMAAEVAALEDVNTAAILKRMTDAEEINKRVRANAEHARVSDELDDASIKSEGLTATIADLDEQKAEAIAAVEYPVEGLAVTDGGIMLGGVPFRQASQAQRLECAVAIGLAQQKDIRVILVREASFFDSECRARVMAMAAAAGAQVWMEVVDDGEMSVVIEEAPVEDGR